MAGCGGRGGDETQARRGARAGQGAPGAGPPPPARPRGALVEHFGAVNDLGLLAVEHLADLARNQRLARACTQQRYRVAQTQGCWAWAEAGQRPPAVPLPRPGAPQLCDSPHAAQLPLAHLAGRTAARRAHGGCPAAPRQRAGRRARQTRGGRSVVMHTREGAGGGDRHHRRVAHRGPLWPFLVARHPPQNTELVDTQRTCAGQRSAAQRSAAQQAQRACSNWLSRPPIPSFSKLNSLCLNSCAGESTTRAMRSSGGYVARLGDKETSVATAPATCGHTPAGFPLPARPAPAW